MKTETRYNKLYDQLANHLAEDTNHLRKREFEHLEEVITVFVDSISEIPKGTIIQSFLLDLEKLKVELSKASQALINNNGSKQIDHFRGKIKDLINNFQSDSQKFLKARESVYENYRNSITKLTDNIKLDFEFLFERYKRRVSLNIGSKFFELLKLEDDTEIRNFLLESIFTCKRLNNDLIELSNSSNGQVNKFLNKITQELGQEIYKELPDQNLKDKDFEDMSPAAKLLEQVKTKAIFSSDSDTVQEFLTAILFSLVGDSKAKIYALLQNKNETNKLTDSAIKRYMKKLEKQLDNLVKKLDREIDTRIGDKIYPIRSYFNRTQNRIMEKFLYPDDVSGQVQKAIDLLGKDIMFTQKKNNYQIFKELLI